MENPIYAHIQLLKYNESTKLCTDAFNMMYIINGQMANENHGVNITKTACCDT